jgi:hypothetical protein
MAPGPTAGAPDGGLVDTHPGARVVRATGREAPVAWLADDVRILCLGDSNRYGLFTIVMVGGNDFWTIPVDVPPGAEPPNALVRFAERHSRLVRLAHMLARAGDTEDLVVPRQPFWGDGWNPRAEASFGDQTFELGFSRDAMVDGEERASAMGRNLEEMVQRARKGGTKLLAES